MRRLSRPSLSRRLRRWAFIVGGIVLAVGIIRLLWPPDNFGLSLNMFEPTSTATSTAGPLTINLPSPDAGIATSSPTPMTSTPTLSVTLIGPNTPADDWANRLLDRVIPLFESGLAPGDGFAWWQSAAEDQIMGFLLPNVLIGGEPFVWDAPRVDVLIPDPARPNQLKPTSQIEADEGTVSLNLLAWEAGQTDSHWIMTSAEAQTPISSLVIQAAARSIQLRVAASDPTVSPMTLVLVGIEQISPITATATLATSSPSSTLPPPPTPTRVPDIVLGRLVSAKVDTAIDALPDVLSDSAAAYASRHPLIGPLEWSEGGARIGGRAVGVSQATELTLEYLAPGMPDGLTVRLMTAQFGDGVTRVITDGMVFQGHRMEEILYWMVLRSTQRQGILVVAYDDFGAKQSIGIVGFTPFP